MSKFRSLIITLGLLVVMSKFSYAQLCTGTQLNQCGGYGSDCQPGYICEPYGMFQNLGRCIYREECPGDESQGNSCSPAGCSATNGCGWGYLCAASGGAQGGLTCVPNTGCRPPEAGNCIPDSNGCSPSCGENRRCEGRGGDAGYWCVNVQGACTDIGPNGENECNSVGCDPICGVGRRCAVGGNRGPGGADRLVCVTDSDNICRATNSTCSSLGVCNPSAESECGPGYSCINYRCVVDTTCLRDTIQVPYTGPKIRNFSTVMAAVYNLLFPGAILFGAIMIIIAGHKLMTSEGDPRKTKEGQEDLSSAVLGTAFVVLSAAILRIIISQILGGSVSF